MNSWILLVIIFSIIGLVVIFLFFRAKTDTTSYGYEWMANQILRFPERMLVDVPDFASSLSEEKRYDILMLVDNELKLIGQLELRRTLLKHFAEMLTSPSADSLYELTNFLFSESSREFRETLSWNGNCNAAIQYLNSLHKLINFSRTNASPKEIRRAFKKIKPIDHVPKNLSERDQKVMQEWVKLNKSLNYAILPKNQRSQKAKKRSFHRRRKNKSRTGVNNVYVGQSHKIKKETVFRLDSFQLVATELYQLTFANQDH